MKLLGNTTVQALLGILILGFYAWSLGKDRVSLKLVQEKQASLGRQNSATAYEQPDGIDIYGSHLAASSLSTKRNIIFFLHADDLQHDLEIWRKVGSLLGPHKNVGLVGYCDGSQCVDSIRKMPPLSFPVLVSGEAKSIQALANADAVGSAIRKDDGVVTQSTILWRDKSSSPQRIAGEALR